MQTHQYMHASGMETKCDQNILEELCNFVKVNCQPLLLELQAMITMKNMISFFIYIIQINDNFLFV